MLFRRKKAEMQDRDDDVVDAEIREKKKWSRRPANTSLKQQRLKAWQPILTPKTVLPTFFIIGIIFAPIGGVLLWASSQVSDFTIDYTQCEFTAPNTTFADIPSDAFSYSISGSSSTPIVTPQWQFTRNTAETNVAQQNLCTIQFTVPKTLESSVFMYYKLTNYYQNHRRYVRSYNSDQLSGEPVSADSLQSNGECKPLATTDNNQPIYPCGLIANSVFNDTFGVPILIQAADSTASTNVAYNMTDRGITWPGESKKYQQTRYDIGVPVPPPFWLARYPNGYTAENPPPDLSQDEHFQVWMRTAGLPTFRKLYFRNDNEAMAAGRYSIGIYMNYPVAQFGGTKSIVFSTVSFIGGKNPFLGIAYIVVAGICVLLGLLLTIRQLVKPRKLGDMRYLSWNQPEKTR